MLPRRKTLIEQSKDLLHRSLRRGDLAVRHYHLTPAARKASALKLARVTTLLDIGANKGQAGRLYRRLGFEGRIHSLEPDPQAAGVLRVWADRYPEWSVEEAAVGREPGSLTLHVHSESQFNSLKPLTHITRENSPQADDAAVVEVSVRTLDEIAEPFAGEQIGLKIDVQGFEEEVLDGGPLTLARAAYVDIELCPVPLYADQILMLELMTRMEREGFSLMAIEDTYSNKQTGQVLSYNGVYVRL